MESGTEKIKEFDLILKEMQQFLKQTYETSSRNETSIKRLSAMKVEAKEFYETKDLLTQQIEAIKYATYDNFRVIRSTDNFIEKYLPFQMQEIVSHNIGSFVKRAFTAEQIAQGADLTMTKEKAEQQERYNAFKQAEYDMYKRFHRAVLQDDGVPNLKKTSFRMPGYRKILSFNEEEAYTIDNEQIYRQA